MIKAHSESSRRVIANGLPTVSETIYLDHYGFVIVANIFHTSTDNFITLDYSNALGNHRFTSPFTVAEKAYDHS